MLYIILLSTNKYSCMAAMSPWKMYTYIVLHLAHIVLHLAYSIHANIIALMVRPLYTYSFSLALVYLPIKAPTHEQNNLKNRNTTKHIYMVPGNTSNYSVMCWGRYDTS